MRARTVQAFLIATGSLVALFAAQAAIGFGGRENPFFVDVLGGGLPFLCAALCLLRGFSGRQERAIWMTLGTGVLVWALGNAYYLGRLADLADPPFPSFADAGYIGFYPFAYAACVLLVRARFRGAPSSVWLDGVIGGLSAASVVAAAALDAVIAATGGTAATVLTTLAAPVGDLLLLALVLGTTAMGGAVLGRRFGVLALGFAVFAITDSVYVYQASVGSYTTGTLLDAGWVVGLFVISAAAWLSGRRDADRAWRAPLGLPAVFAVVAIGVLALATRQPGRPVTTLLAILALIAVVVRMAWTVREHERVLQRTRRESLTDELTGLGNRRALLSDLGEACRDGTTAALALFDLNGFKVYNDTFGHVAGDSLLARLADNLTAAAGSATVYRLGGDEFCVLARDPERLEALMHVTADALCEHGDGFTVTAAAGWARFPHDATTSADLLRVADQRMYAEKGGQRSPAIQSAAVLVAALREHDLDLDHHGTEVAQYAVALAERCGLSRVDVERTRQTAELHDVGKMAVPDAILSKPGPLDEAEWSYVRTHTVIGERILLAAPALHDIGALVRSTHERWNGTGYPDALPATEIPLPARIVSICDAFDAMTSDRPYRAAMSTDAALAELDRCAGSAFDPGLVRTFCAMVLDQTLATSAL